MHAWNFVARRSGEQRLREEVEQHIAFETAANILAGMTLAQAHRAAMVKFGPVEAIRENYHSENVKTLDQIRDDSLASRTFAMRLLVGFAGVGSLLTLVGIYGVLSLSVVSRRRELAIRCAVGAQHSDIRRLILGEGFRVIAGGVLLGAALSVALSQALKSFLYQVEPSDPATLIVVGLLFVGVSLLACWVPAWRAEKVDPLEALRHD
jgi:putative ABC transport system permease protein